MPIHSTHGVVAARQQGRALAMELGFSGAEQVAIATAISEVARNIVQYARDGSIVLSTVERDDRIGIRVVACDRGPGIPNIEQAMQDGYSTSGGLGLGLPGARRLMDELQITSEVGEGTTVTMKKWRRPND